MKPGIQRFCVCMKKRRIGMTRRYVIQLMQVVRNSDLPVMMYSPVPAGRK